MFKCSRFMWLLDNNVVTKEHFRSAHAKGAFVPTLSSQITGSGGSIHKTPPARCDQIRKNCFAPRARVGNCHRRDEHVQSVCASQPTGIHFATLALCVSKKSVHVSPSLVQYLHCYVLCASFSRTSFTFLGCPWERPSCVPVSRTGYVLNQVLKNLRHVKKTFLKYPFNLRPKKLVAFDKFFQRIDVISKLLCP